jgi:hypothetical protein
VRGLLALRNLAAHAGNEQEVTVARAREYIALVQAILFAPESTASLTPEPVVSKPAQNPLVERQH